MSSFKNSLSSNYTFQNLNNEKEQNSSPQFQDPNINLQKHQQFLQQLKNQWGLDFQNELENKLQLLPQQNNTEISKSIDISESNRTQQNPKPLDSENSIHFTQMFEKFLPSDQKSYQKETTFSPHLNYADIFSCKDTAQFMQDHFNSTIIRTQLFLESILDHFKINPENSFEYLLEATCELICNENKEFISIPLLDIETKDKTLRGLLNIICSLGQVYEQKYKNNQINEIIVQELQSLKDALEKKDKTLKEKEIELISQEKHFQLKQYHLIQDAHKKIFNHYQELMNKLEASYKEKINAINKKLSLSHRPKQLQEKQIVTPKENKEDKSNEKIKSKIMNLERQIDLFKNRASNFEQKLNQTLKEKTELDTKLEKQNQKIIGFEKTIKNQQQTIEELSKKAQEASQISLQSDIQSDQKKTIVDENEIDQLQQVVQNKYEQEIILELIQQLSQPIDFCYNNQQLTSIFNLLINAIPSYKQSSVLFSLIQLTNNCVKKMQQNHIQNIQFQPLTKWWKKINNKHPNANKNSQITTFILPVQIQHEFVLQLKDILLKQQVTDKNINDKNKEILVFKIQIANIIFTLSDDCQTLNATITNLFQVPTELQNELQKLYFQLTFIDLLISRLQITDNQFINQALDILIEFTQEENKFKEEFYKKLSHKGDILKKLLQNQNERVLEKSCIIIYRTLLKEQINPKIIKEIKEVAKEAIKKRFGNEFLEQNLQAIIDYN